MYAINFQCEIPSSGGLIIIMSSFGFLVMIIFIVYNFSNDAFPGIFFLMDLVFQGVFKVKLKH